MMDSSTSSLSIVFKSFLLYVDLIEIMLIPNQCFLLSFYHVQSLGLGFFLFDLIFGLTLKVDYWPNLDSSRPILLQLKPIVSPYFLLHDVICFLQVKHGYIDPNLFHTLHFQHQGRWPSNSIIVKPNSLPHVLFPNKELSDKKTQHGVLVCAKKNVNVKLDHMTCSKCLFLIPFSK